jgi:hypothetical protein
VSERDVRRRLVSISPPDELEAERRAWAVVRTAFEEREPVERPRPQLVRPLLVLAFVLALIAAVVNPPVLNALRDALGRDREKTVYRPALFRLPANGRLLVNSAHGPWVVKPRGAKRLLGRYREASWSPRGKFVVALRAHELVALEPDGAVRWSLTRSGNLAFPRWSQELAGSTRIVYLRGRELRVVAGNDTGDRLLNRRVARVAPAWRPGDTFDVSYVGRAGRVQVEEVDTGRPLWRSGRLGRPLALAWSGDGERLVVLLPHAAAVFGRKGRRLGGTRVDGTAEAVTFQPRTHRFAVLSRDDSTGRGTITLFDADTLRSSRRLLLSADGSFRDLAWSPDGKWLQTAWRTADAWLFVGPKGRQKVVSSIGRQFSSGPGGRASFPSVPEGGWCCAPTD